MWLEKIQFFCICKLFQILQWLGHSVGQRKPWVVFIPIRSGKNLDKFGQFMKPLSQMERGEVGGPVHAGSLPRQGPQGDQPGLPPTSLEMSW